MSRRPDKNPAMTAPDRVILALTGLAAAAYHIGRRGDDAEKPSDDELAANIKAMQPLIRAAEHEMRNLVGALIGGSVLAALDELVNRHRIRKRAISNGEVTEILNAVSHVIMEHPLRVEEVVISDGPGTVQ